MAISEFRFNKKRKHYTYIFKKRLGLYRKNIVFTTKSIRVWKGKIKNNIKLFRHPNINSKKVIYVIPIIYIDHVDSFHPAVLPWNFDKNDKRTIKRLKYKKWK